MLQSEEDPEDGRGTRRYSITESGEARLRTWLRAPLPREAVAISPDPVRTRISFLSVLPPEERLAFLEATEEQMRAAQAELRLHAQEVERSNNVDEQYATLGAVAAMRARLRWIRDLLARERAGAPIEP